MVVLGSDSDSPAARHHVAFSDFVQYINGTEIDSMKDVCDILESNEGRVVDVKGFDLVNTTAAPIPNGCKSGEPCPSILESVAFRAHQGHRRPARPSRASEASARTLQHWHKYLLLANRFLRRLLDLHLEFVDDVERELAPKAGRGRSCRRRSSPPSLLRLCVSTAARPRAKRLDERRPEWDQPLYVLERRCHVEIRCAGVLTDAVGRPSAGERGAHTRLIENPCNRDLRDGRSQPFRERT